MPERFNVVRLTESEKEGLVAAVKKSTADAVAGEVKRVLNQGAETVAAAAKGPDLDVGALRAAYAALAARAKILQDLPDGEAKRQVLEATMRALGVLNEALSMLDAAPPAPAQPQAAAGV